MKTAWCGRLALALDGLNRLAALACHLLLVAITMDTVAQVFLRLLLNSPTRWSEEIALLFLIWFGLLAVAVESGATNMSPSPFCASCCPCPLPLASITLHSFPWRGSCSP
jgi:hypothetical protein